jgi:hypothetical protein
LPKLRGVTSEIWRRLNLTHGRRASSFRRFWSFLRIHLWSDECPGSIGVLSSHMANAALPAPLTDLRALKVIWLFAVRYSNDW